MIILLIMALLIGGAFVASRGLESYKRAGRQALVIAGGAMMAVGTLLGLLFLLAARGIGLVF